jgi:hypothetical protein
MDDVSGMLDRPVPPAPKASAGPKLKERAGALAMAASRAMTVSQGAYTGFPVYGIDAVRPPSTGKAWPLT